MRAVVLEETPADKRTGGRVGVAQGVAALVGEQGLVAVAEGDQRLVPVVDGPRDDKLKDPVVATGLPEREVMPA